MQQLQAAVQAYQSKDLDSAEAILKKILAVNPKEPNSLHLLGCIYKDRGQLQQAVELMQASIREDGSNPIPFLNLGKTLSIAGQHENAAGVFQESLKRNQQIPETWFCFGNATREIEKVEEAKQAYRNALQLNPAHSGAASNLGALLTDDGELEEAERLFLAATAQAPNDVNIRINFGKLLSEKDEHAAAIVQYQIAMPLAPRSPELLYNFAVALKEEGEVEEAIASYRKAIEVKPDFAEAYLNLGNVVKEEGEVEEAIASYRKAIEVKPDFADAYFQLAFFLIRQGRVLESLDFLRNGVQQCKKSPKIKHLLGTLLISQGQEEEGRMFIEEAFSIDSAFGRKVDGFSLRSDTAEGFWQSLHSKEKAHLGYWKQNPRRKKLASVICSIEGVTSVLECGCNVGGNLFAINAINDQIKLKGVDMNASPVEFGKRKFMELDIDVDMSVMRLQDLGNIESNSVDVAFTSAVLQHIPSEFISDILANMIRISKKYVVLWELHGFSPADALVHRHFIDASPSLDGRWLHDYWNILEQLGVERELITAQQLDPRICLGKVSDANCIFSFPVP